MSEPTQRLQEMLSRIEKIESICEKNQGIVKALEEEVYSQPAIMMHLIVIQEQIVKLQNESEYNILSRFAKEDLRGIAAIRNIASHDYEGLNFAIIEDSLRFYLPNLKKAIIAILQTL